MFERPKRYTEELAARILDRLRAGEPIKEACADYELPATRTFYAWRIEQPAFDARVKEVIDRQGRGPDGRISPGFSGNPRGRPVGVRRSLHRLKYLDELYRDMARGSVKGAIERFRERHPDRYVELVARLLLREVGGL